MTVLKQIGQTETAGDIEREFGVQTESLQGMEMFNLHINFAHCSRQTSIIMHASCKCTKACTFVCFLFENKASLILFTCLTRGT